MLVRTALVTMTAALMPFAGGSAHASCLDDLVATNLAEGHTETPKSEHWNSGRFPHSHVEQTGPATFTVYGDALVSDSVSWLTVDWPSYLGAAATNAGDATVAFADCVAG